MGQGAGIPLKDRRGPTYTEPDGAPGATADGRSAGGGPSPPPGTPCWISLGDSQVAGVVLGWQAGDGGANWHAMVSCWLPAQAVSRRR
jgi:hypothetical protein